MESAQQVIKVLICCEWYRTKEQTYDENDYFVDGIKLMPITVAFETNDPKQELITALPTFLGDLKKAAVECNATLSMVLPKFVAKVQSGDGFWFHATTEIALSKRPNEFHGNAFSEAELLGTTEQEDDSSEALTETLSLYFSSEGSYIEGPPDKFMLAIGAA